MKITEEIEQQNIMERRDLPPKSYNNPNNNVGYFQVITNLITLQILLIWASFELNFWIGFLLFISIGLVQHKLFFVAHDLLHNSLFTTKSKNRLFGSLISALLGTSFDAMREQHMDHHRRFGTIQDPGAPDYFVKFRSRCEFLLFIFSPLLGSLLIQRIGGYILSPAKSATSNIPEKRQGKFSLNFSVIKPYLILTITQFYVFFILTQGMDVGEFWRYIVFYILPLVTVFLFLIRLRMFLEHGSLNYEVCNYFENLRPTTRTIYASKLERFLICGNNFNYHHEHHLYPSVPGFQLCKLHEYLLGKGLVEAEDMRLTYRDALLEIWKNLPWKLTTL